jgi:PhnB protein
MKAIHPYINLPGNTEEAFAFYGKVFGTEPFGKVLYRDMGGEAMGLKGADLEKVAHMALPLNADHMLMGTDVIPATGQPPVSFGNSTYIMLDADSTEEAQRLFDGLVAGGTAEMPMSKTEWAESYGCCIDKYGIRWMVNYTGSVVFEQPS